MQYLSSENLDRIDATSFRATRPYPWVNAAELIAPASYRRLYETLPSVKAFKSAFGRRRRHGQASHDRYVLEYRPVLSLPEPWQTFVDEIHGPVYREFVARLIGHERFWLHCHWHYTPSGCSVSPHCDASFKLGSHIFYFNTEADWNPAWGGETLILDDEGKFRPDSAPRFEDFARQLHSTSLGNNSLFFVRNGNSWHGVSPIRCPQDALRKVFIVEIRRDRPFNRLRSFFGI